MKKIVSLIVLVVLFSSCSEYQKALKSEEISFKYETSVKMYDKGRYDKAIRLFEQIAPSYKGKPQAEKLFYMFSQAYYKTKQYYLAGYQFESFASSYPKSEKVEEAAFLGAKCYSKLSPVYSLDQGDTDKALDKLQNFIDQYPNSTYLADANAIVKDLRNKLEKKAFENAKQYNTIADYKASQIAFDNFISDFPGTSYKEDALFYKLDSAYKLAENSVVQKMEERLNAAKNAYHSLTKYKADSKYKKQADDMLAKIENDLKQFSK